ncbi:MAG: hypothetical protein M1813_008333 [Trichoglossum hirsutum]|nr:MAG: hypothetical protein M1813_008333 [Trichoglossum hirsutum]
MLKPPPFPPDVLDSLGRLLDEPEVDIAEVTEAVDDVVGSASVVGSADGHIVDVGNATGLTVPGRVMTVTF